MAEILVDKTKCVGCKKCAGVCPFGCITFFNDYPVIAEDCRLCQQCIKACAFNALSLSGGKLCDVGLDVFSGVMVFAEQRDGKILDVAFELLGKARELATALGEEVFAVLCGHNMQDAAKELVAYGADKVYVFDDERLAVYRGDPYTHVITELVNEVRPSIFLVGATSVGRILAPRITTRMRTGLTADCTYLEVDPKTKLLLQTRPAFGGNIMATIKCETRRPQMSTVRPKVIEMPSRDDKRNGEIIQMDVPEVLLDRVKLLGRVCEGCDVDISEADIIVVGGRGVERKEGFAMLSELANLLGGMVGSTRPPVDEGWISYAHQIGLSGKTVRPKLYIACGVSGSVQHMAGMETSDYIIAINKDPEAPIFKISDLGIVGDLYSIIPELIETLKKQKKKK